MTDVNYEQRAKFTRELPVQLNDHELQIYGRMCAEKVREIALAEETEKTRAAQVKAKIKLMRQELNRIATARAQGEELRAVDCAERLHGNVIEIVRCDNGIVIDTRPADISDLQPTLPEVNMDPPPRDGEPPPDNVVPFIDPGAPVTPGEVYEGEVPDGELSSEPAPGEGNGDPDSVEAGESEELIDNAPLAQRDRDIAQREREIAEERAQAGGKPKRDRSAKRNGGKRGK